MQTFKLTTCLIKANNFNSITRRVVSPFLTSSTLRGMASINKSDEEWRKILTPEQYEVARKRGTEKAFTGDLLENKDSGVYKCVCCGADLFESNSKFDSGSGWPSFHTAKDAKGSDDSNTNVHRHEDFSHGMKRVEVICKNCDAHLGHVFDDGPNPTGLRYCINSVCLKFQKS